MLPTLTFLSKNEPKKKREKKKEIPLFLKKRGLKLDSFGIQTLNFMNAGWKH